MVTRTKSRTSLVGYKSLSFIRPQTIKFAATDLKPNSKFYAFFDTKSVDEFIKQDGKNLGDQIVSDAAGKITGEFRMPGNTFNTGERIFKLLDTSNYETEAFAGSAVSSATTLFTANGFLDTFQKTINVITQNVVRVNTTRPPGDPLAQTFFTYGIKGGCFVTMIEVFFQAKDASIPVRCELRNVENGYPAADLVNEWSFVSLNPSSVNTSNTALVGTKFIFPRPIYLPEDKDFCFVLLSNSNSYYAFTSEMGAKSIETGKTISEQPFVGSMFKSENNITWTAEQTQDIKFNIYRAKFDISSQASLKLRAVAPNDRIPGKYFSVTNSSPLVTCTLPMQHGFKTSDTIILRGLTGATYRGIPSAILSSSTGYTVTRVNDFTFTFSLGATNATSTGILSSTGRMEAIEIDDGGINYSAPTVQIIGDGTGATATVTTSGGKINTVTITNAGTGYMTTPTVKITDGTGSGASLTVIDEAIFATSLNRRYQAVAPLLNTIVPNETGLSATLRTTDENYLVGLHENISLSQATILDKEAVIATLDNEQLFFGSDSSAEMLLYFESKNVNVSPMLDLRATPRLVLENNNVNDILTNPASTFDKATELTPSGGTAYARYISQPFQLETISKGARVIVTASSIATTSFNVYFRSSLAASTVPHKSGNWVEMTCDTARNLARKLGEYQDYEFKIDDLDGFDMYDIKIVLSSNDKISYPVIDQYRSIIVAT